MFFSLSILPSLFSTTQLRFHSSHKQHHNTTKKNITFSSSSQITLSTNHLFIIPYFFYFYFFNSNALIPFLALALLSYFLSTSLSASISFTLQKQKWPSYHHLCPEPSSTPPTPLGDPYLSTSPPLQSAGLPSFPTPSTNPPPPLSSPHQQRQ